MSYYSKRVRQGQKQIDESMTRARAEIDRNAMSEATYRAWLKKRIETTESTILDLNKELAKFNISAKDDPAEMRKVITASGGGQGAAARAGTILETYRKYQTSSADLQTDWKDSIADDYDHEMKPLDFATALLSGVGSDEVKATMTAFQNKTAQQQRQFISDTLITMDNALSAYPGIESRSAHDVLVGQLDAVVPGLGTTLKAQFPESSYGADAGHGLALLNQEKADSLQRAVGIGIATPEGLVEAHDAVLKRLKEGKGLGATGWESQRMELTQEAKDIREKRATQEYRAVQKALNNDGEITETEEAEWLKVRPETEKRTLQEIRDENIDDFLLNRLEQKGYLVRALEGAEQAKAQLTEDLATRSDVDQSEEAVRGRAGEIYEPHRLSRIGAGVAPPRVSQAASALGQMVEDLPDEDKILMQGAVDAQDEEIDDEFTEQLLTQIDDKATPRDVLRKTQNVVDQMETDVEKARERRRKVIASFFRRKKKTLEQNSFAGEEPPAR